MSEIYSRKLDLDNLQGERRYSYFRAYFASKLAAILFTTELARRIDGSGVTVAAVSPGPAKTNFGGGGPSGLMGLATGVLKHTPLVKPADQAAGGIAWAAAAPELADNSGALYMRRSSSPSRARPMTSHSPPRYGPSASSRRKSTQPARQSPPSQPPSEPQPPQPPADRRPDPGAATSPGPDSPGP